VNAQAYIDAASRAAMCAAFAVADANNAHPDVRESNNARDLRNRIEQIEEYTRKMREALK
jgi:hypothetical protein